MKKRSRVVNKKRFYTFIFVCLVFFSLIVTLFINVKSSLGATKTIYTDSYIVRQNDTVWSIAEKVKHDNRSNIDTREIVDIILFENEMYNANIVPGNKIKIPSL